MSSLCSSEGSSSLGSSSALPIGCEDILNQFEQKVFLLCLYLTSTSTEAEMLLADVFATAVEEFELELNKRPTDSWFYCKVIDLLSSKNLVKLTIEQNSGNQIRSQANSRMVRGKNPQKTNQCSPISLALALQRLPFENRVVYCLREIIGLSVEEVSVISSISTLEVRAFHHRARLMLRQELA